MKPVATLVLRRRLLLLAFALAGVAVLARAFQLQALESDRWTAAAEEQQRERLPLPARRGTIYDRDGVALALSHETFRVSVAPREVRDPAALRTLLREELGASDALAGRATDVKRRWVVLPGRFTAEQRERVGATAGVYFERRLERFYPQGDVGRELIGVVSADGRPLGGIEQRFDDVLRGEAGYSVLRRDARGGVLPALSLPVAPPSDGADVHLTIDLDLQEIADDALRAAIAETRASGGDLVMLDPRTGELLAAVSRRGGHGRALAALTEPYEPGSTLKPFIAAALLTEGRARLTDSIDGEEGVWRDPNGRTIRDVHAMDALTLRTTLVESSNIGIAKFSSRLPAARQYEYLRDFGFGTPTGVEYPSEASGRLPRPAHWSRLSQASLAMGYEISVTPLQLAAGYGALANGGVLMEPYLVREIRPARGSPARREPRAVRRVIPAGVAATLTEVLQQVVEEGTASRAALASFAVAGKTGTARRTGPNGRYEPGAYTATFAGFFPADDPQVVIVVKLDRPQGAYYGGSIAAPVTRETLHGIVAAHSSALDGRTLLAALMPPPLGAAARASRPVEPRRSGPTSEGTYVFLLDDARRAAAPPGGAAVGMPPLEGLALRDAARRAHAVGLHVRVDGTGRVRETRPAAGVELAWGDTVLLIGGGS